MPKYFNKPVEVVQWMLQHLRDGESRSLFDLLETALTQHDYAEPLGNAWTFSALLAHDAGLITLSCKNLSGDLVTDVVMGQVNHAAAIVRITPYGGMVASLSPSWQTDWIADSISPTAVNARKVLRSRLHFSESACG